MVNGRGGRALLGVVVVLAMLCVACGSGKSPTGATGQGFVPAPDVPTTNAVNSTATSVPSVAKSPTPTPLGTPNVQASAQANGCPITPFGPNYPPQMQDNVFPQWYGQGDLWFAPPSIYAEFGMEQLANATVWFQGITPAVVLTNGNPTVSGHLHGDASTTLKTSSFDTSLLGTIQGKEPAHGVAVNLPQPGCWDVTIDSGNETLNVTLWAVPIDQRPDVASRLASEAAETPYPPPSSCDVTNWNGPADHLAPFFADYWQNGQGITVDSNARLFFAAKSSNLDIYQSLPDTPNLTGQLQGDSSAVVRSSWIQRSSVMSSNGWHGELTFSNPGCWQLQVTAGTAKVDLTLYVYPADCYHALNEPKPATCKPPA